MNPRASTPATRSTGRLAAARAAKVRIDGAERGAVGDQRHDVLEHDARLREVRDVAQPRGDELGDLGAGVADRPAVRGG